MEECLMDKEIKEIEFVFENSERVTYNYDQFKFCNINNEDIHFRIENGNIYRLNEYQDICNIYIIYKDGIKQKIQVPWYDNYNDNLYQFVNYKNLPQGIIEITISKKKYLCNEIKETKQEISNLNKKLNNLQKQLQTK
jgi:hypothetical protein